MLIHSSCSAKTPAALTLLALAMPGMIALGETPDGKNPPLTEAVVHRAAGPLSDEAVTHDWPTFLGPTHNGISRETRLKTTWSTQGPPLVWSMESGGGYAAPSIGEDRLVYFHRQGDFEVVECLHPETGKRFWHYAYPVEYSDGYGFGNGPRATPVIHGGMAYTFGVEGKLHAFDLESGSVVWKHDIRRDYNVPLGFFGIGSSPVMVDGNLIVNIGAPGGPTVISFQGKTGVVNWKTGEKWGAGYASPIPATVFGRQRIFVFAGGDDRPPTGGLFVLNPATGAIDFQFPFRSSKYESVNASSPVIVGNTVFLTTSYRTGGVLLSLKSDGGYDVAWKTDDFGSHFPTPIAIGGYIYGFDGMSKNDTGLVCHELATGKQVWRTQPEFAATLTQNGKTSEVPLSTYRGSLLYADKTFICLSETGHLLSMDLSPEKCRVRSAAMLFYAQETWVAPVLSRGLLYVTQNRPDVVNKKPMRLLCYDLR
ncbi:MAG: PQQ-binding-like beta-propeller repeat protein [Planctomycetota bacterium]|jgi:outer membrane protein assembly factor BamB